MTTKKMKSTIDYTTGELNEEINARAEHLAASIIEVNQPTFRQPMSRIRLITETEGESMTHQSHAASCDINVIINQFSRTGQLPPNHRQPQYADVTHLSKDLTTLYNDMMDIGERIRQAQKDIAANKKAEAAKEKAELEEFRKSKSTPPATPGATPPPAAG